MIKEFYGNKNRALWAWGGALFLFVSLYAQVHMSVLFNEWYGSFYTMLQTVDDYTKVDFWNSLAWFTKIALIYIVLATFTAWFTRIYAFKWRKALTYNYIPKWVKCKEDIEGASQRIQQDTERFARIMESLGLQIIKAGMTLIAFIPILWGLSEGLILEFNGYEIPWFGTLPGHLFWSAFMTSAIGLIMAWFVGYYLPTLEYNNQVVEAKYRKELVHGEDDKINYASPRTLVQLFVGVEHNYHRLFLHQTYLDAWISFYDQVMIIFPYIVAGPSVMTKLITLGALVQISNAFGQVHNSFSLPIHNWHTITELRSIIKRLREFEANINNQTEHIYTKELKQEEKNLYEILDKEEKVEMKKLMGDSIWIKIIRKIFTRSQY